MPFDPSLPSPNSPLQSQVVRDQFQALFNLINAVPVVTAAQVDSVTTGSPGDPAGVTASVTGDTLHLGFTLPKGDTGPQGPPFAAAVVDGVTTLPANAGATVTATFDGTTVHFDFGIPTGVPGEVSAAQLTDAVNNALGSALSNSSANTNAVALLNLAAGTSSVQAELQALGNKLDELILAMRRS